ncbi:hypothetical protein [Novosphingobium sp. 9U]|uniref:hypothetical protein n=1 Tax=Novosphingobium sp. 9U TaxID=2653158 RepID=UPI00135C7497|nr:hypothetical protein [Novosphingobium sp. 9U]
MRRIKPATVSDGHTITMSIEHLRQARILLRKAGAVKAVAAVNKAMRSADGAARHVQHRIRRTTP